MLIDDPPLRQHGAVEAIPAATSWAVMVCPAPLRVTPFGIVSGTVVSQSPVKVMTPPTGCWEHAGGGCGIRGRRLGTAREDDRYNGCEK